MRKRPIKSTLIALTIAGLGLSILTACGGTSAAPAHTSPTASAAPCPGVVSPLTQAEIDKALFMREEEKLARDVYDELAAYWLAQVGTVPVVTIADNISDSEQQHMDSMKAVLDCYGLPDPVDAAETPGVFIAPELGQLYATLVAQGRLSQLDALKVGALIEEVDIADLQASIEISQQAYTDAVYASLMCGSRNHMRAFVGQIIKTEGSYTAQAIDQATVDAIVNSPMENCGR
ncbi:MAG: DUF2202 domain-containing protein [Gammaproteobacteria bacterium]|nr:DUF2202 domain-containing protein [Gammaproteobacteria bacterium]